METETARHGMGGGAHVFLSVKLLFFPPKHAHAHATGHIHPHVTGHIHPHVLHAEGLLNGWGGLLRLLWVFLFRTERSPKTTKERSEVRGGARRLSQCDRRCSTALSM
eukprot:1406238-Pyramimonas_sp.AAC.1